MFEVAMFYCLVPLFEGGKNGLPLLFMLQRRIDVRCNVPDVVLQAGIPGGDGLLHLLDGVEDGGVVLVQLLADVRGGEVGQFPDQVNGHLPGLCGALVFQRTPKDGFVDGVELADLRDDQIGGGQGVTLGLEHVVNSPGDVGKIQGHIV